MRLKGALASLRGTGGDLPGDQYWDHPDAVTSMPATGGALAYEVACFRDAVARAGGPAAIRRAHVVGVGAGRELPAVVAAAPGADVAAWDLSPAMVEACRAFVAAEGLGAVEVGVGDIGAGAPLGRPGQLVVASNSVLGCVRPATARRNAFAALAGMLEPGGALMLVVQQRRGRPDWAVWFAAQAVLDRLGRVEVDRGDVRNARGPRSVLVHHYSPPELRGHLEDAGFGDIWIQSLRTWARSRGIALPSRSPNPLLAVATRG